MFLCNKHVRNSIGRDEQILAFDATSINYWYHQVYTPTDGCITSTRKVCTNRYDLEGNGDWKQAVAYVVAMHTDGQCVFVYQRDRGDARLSMKSSIGVGGHVSLSDVIYGDDIEDSIMHTAKRELAEEVYFENRGRMKLVGIINDNSDAVGKDHVGFVITMQVSGEWKIKEKDAFVEGSCGFYNIGHLPLREYENWSQILIEEFLGK